MGLGSSRPGNSSNFPEAVGRRWCQYPVVTEQRVPLGIHDRNLTAAERDELAAPIDAIAESRDRSAEARDVRAQQREDSTDRADPNAASDRSAARRDRQAARSDREHARHDREAASRDWEISTQEASSLVIDDLTGTYLRGPGLQELGREVIKAKRTGQSFVLVFIDVDHLKSTNDGKGHDAGDRLLEVVGAAVRSRMREYDVVVRYGGDEFVCGVLDSDLPAVAQRFRTVDADLAAAGAGTISYGIVELGPEDELDDLIERADRAMYEKRRAWPVS